MKDLKKYFAFNPTSEQIEALEKIIEFCVNDFNPSNRAYILKGHAGTGKTSLINALLNYFREYNKQFDDKDENRREFSLLASTGRAAKILSEKTRRKTITIHRQIFRYEPETNNQSNNRIVFSLVINNHLKNMIFVVDESSMIGNLNHSDSYLQFGSGKTLSDLLLYVRNQRIIFVGDSAQLPPVNEKLSVALSPTALSEYFGINPNNYHLQKVMRFNENSSIFINSQMVLKSILDNDFPESFALNFSGDDINVYQEIEDMVNMFVKCFNRDRNNVSNCIFVVSTNKLAAEINSSIRGKIFNKPTFLNNGEFLMVTKNNYLLDIMNGDTIKVINIENNSIKAPGLDSLHFRKITAGIGIEPYYTTFSTLIIEESLKSVESGMGLELEKELLQNFIIRMKSRGFSTDSPEFVTHLMKDPFLNALRVKYGYAVTGHKSQGGEWKDVFIVFQSMLFADKDKRNSYRWIYTSLTRASEKLHVLKDIGYIGKPDNKNYKMGKFLEMTFSGKVLVDKQYFWKSAKGTSMCTLATKTENFVFAQFKIKYKALRAPIFPAYAVFENGYLEYWEK